MFRLTFLTGLLFSASALAQQVCPSGNLRNAPDSRYVTAADATVRDSQTNLIWKRCSEGQSGPSCAGTASTHTWATALQLASNSTFAGFSDWRLPSSKELQTLPEYGCYSPSINLTVFPNTPSNGFWSSTSCADLAFAAWYVFFNNGNLDGAFKTLTNRVRLVRGGQ